MKMKKSEVIDLLEQIDLFYPGRFRMEDPQKTINSWHNLLKDEDPKRIEENLIYHAKNSQYVPGISDLLKEPEGKKRVTPNADETQAYLKRYEEKANQPKDEEEIKKIQQEIRKMLNIKGE